MKKKISTIVTSCLMFLNIDATPLQPQIKITEFDLPNGLHVILHANLQSPVVSISVMYGTGTSNDALGKEGMTNFAQKLKWSGEKTTTEDDYIKKIENVGGVTKAQTTLDYTVFSTTLPSNHLELGLWIESQRMKNMAIDSQAFKTIKQKFLLEQEALYNNESKHFITDTLLMFAFKKLLYKKGLSQINEDFFRSLKVNEAIDFCQQKYCPNNATISVVGNFNEFEIKDLVYKYFFDIPIFETIKTIRKKIEPEFIIEIRDSIKNKSFENRLLMAYLIPEVSSPNRPYIEMLLTQLYHSKNGLQQLENNPQEQILNLEVKTMNLKNKDLAIIQVIVPPQVRLNYVEKKVQEIIDYLISNTIDKEDILKNKKLIKNNFQQQTTTLERLSNSLLFYHFYFNNANKINQYMNDFEQMNSEKLLQISNEYFNNSNRVVLYFSNTKNIFK